MTQTSAPPAPTTVASTRSGLRSLYLIRIAFSVVWVVLVASLSSWIGALPVLVQALIYVLLGVIWIAPLKPVLRWMELGR